MPFQNSHLIHPRWSEHHRPVVERSMTGMCIITRYTGESTYNPTTGDVVRASETVYDGLCRVQQLNSRAIKTMQADQTVILADYLVVVEWDIPQVYVGENGDTLKVYECAEDIELINVPMRIVSQAHGTLRWERDLWCQIDQALANAGTD